MGSDVYSLPKKRKFVDGKGITVSMRMPEALKEALDAIADNTGRKFSDITQDALDEFCDFYNSNNADTKRAKGGANGR